MSRGFNLNNSICAYRPSHGIQKCSTNFIITTGNLVCRILTSLLSILSIFSRDVKLLLGLLASSSGVAVPLRNLGKYSHEKVRIANVISACLRPEIRNANTFENFLIDPLKALRPLHLVPLK
jgi:hypothetical protein